MDLYSKHFTSSKTLNCDKAGGTHLPRVAVYALLSVFCTYHNKIHTCIFFNTAWGIKEERIKVYERMGENVMRHRFMNGRGEAVGLTVSDREKRRRKRFLVCVSGMSGEPLTLKSGLVRGDELRTDEDVITKQTSRRNMFIKLFVVLYFMFCFYNLSTFVSFFHSYFSVCLVGYINRTKDMRKTKTNKRSCLNLLYPYRSTNKITSSRKGN